MPDTKNDGTALSFSFLRDTSKIVQLGLLVLSFFVVAVVAGLVVDVADAVLGGGTIMDLLVAVMVGVVVGVIVIFFLVVVMELRVVVKRRKTKRRMTTTTATVLNTLVD